MGATMSYTRTPRGWVRKVATAPAGYRRANQPGLPRGCWKGNRRYTLYRLRELSSLFLALWAVRLLTRLDRLRRGKEDYEAFVAAQRRPAWVLYHLITLLFALLHAVTFLVAAGKGPTPHIRGRRVSEQTIAAGAFAGWAVASLGVALALQLGGRRQDA